MTIKTIKQIQQGLETFRLAFTNRDIIKPMEAQMDSFTDPGTTVITDNTGATTQSETFLSTHDAAVKALTREAYYRLPQTIINNASDGINMSVSEFLRRPCVVQNGSFAGVDTATTFGSHNVFEPLLYANILPKLKGVMSFRATTVITLQVNANRFQQGIYILAFMPLGGIANSSPFATDFYKMHRYSRTQITQLMHAKLDLNCDTEVQLRIPYTSCTSSFPLRQGAVDSNTGSPGVYFLYPYVPIASTSGPTTAGFTLWSHYEDVELLGNTVSQVGWEAQSGRSVVKGKDLLASEMFNDKPLSTGLKLASTITTHLAKVPLLSSIATPLSWVLEASANAAFYWGWSKPVIIQNTSRVIREPAPYIGNSDGVDTSSPLSLSVENRVGILPGFGGTDLDEMSIDFIKSKFAWIDAFAFTTSSVQETKIFSRLVNASEDIKEINDGSNIIASFTPIAFLGYLYTYWRGSVVYRIKFAKTEFHSGRLELRYIPFNQAGGAPTTSYADQQYTMREIWDLRECSEITVSLPYMSVFPWRTCDTDGNIGLFEIWVLDALVAPATVPSTIIANVEVCGGEDMAFSVPKAYSDEKYAPIIPATLQCGWEAQSGDEQCAVETKVIGGAVIEDRSFIHEEVCIGEVALSLRQLVKRGGFVNPNDTAPASGNWYAIQPNVIGVYTSNVAGTDGSPNYDPYATIGMCYAQSRGGVRVKLLPSLAGSTALVKSSFHNYKRTIFKCYEWNTLARDAGHIIMRSQIGLHLTSLGAICVQIPQYLQTISRVIAGNMLVFGRTLTSTAEFTDPNFVSFWRDPDTLTSEVYYYWRSGADDLNFGDFVCIPAMAKPQVH